MEVQESPRTTNRFLGGSRIALIVGLILLNMGCDQISKNVVRERVEQNEQINVIGDNVILTNVENEGAFLGVGSELDRTTKNILLLALPAVMLLILTGMVFVRSNLSTRVAAGMSCIIGGGLGNMLDRFIYGSVTDFLHLDLELFRTGIFNLADVSVTLGMLIILATSLLNKKDRLVP